MSTTAEFLTAAMPAAPEAESALLGKILRDGELWATTSAEITFDDFYSEHHRRIFSTMADVIAAGQKIDVVTIMEWMVRNKTLDAIGGAGVLCDLDQKVSLSVYDCFHYIAILKDRAKLRATITAAMAAQVRGLESGITGDELVSSLSQRLSEIESQTAEPETTIADDVLSAMYEIEMESQSTRELLGATLCLPALDSSVMGVRRGELLVIGGMPERAKTAFALQLGRTNARRGDWVDFHSLEMGKNQVTRRNLATMAGVHPSKVRDPRSLTPEDKRKLQDAAADLAKLPFQIHKHRGLTPAKLFSKMRLSVQRHKRALAEAGRLHIIIVDHLKALSFCCPGQDERHRMNHAIEMLRRFTDDEQVVVIVLHHLNRPQTNINEFPTVLRLKESGDIEAAGNIILALHREETDDGTFTGKDFILILKMREGEKGPIPAEFDKYKLEYKPRAWQ